MSFRTVLMIFALLVVCSTRASAVDRNRFQKEENGMASIAEGRRKRIRQRTSVAVNRGLGGSHDYFRSSFSDSSASGSCSKSGCDSGSGSKIGSERSCSKSGCSGSGISCSKSGCFGSIPSGSCSKSGCSGSKSGGSGSKSRGPRSKSGGSGSKSGGTSNHGCNTSGCLPSGLSGPSTPSGPSGPSKPSSPSVSCSKSGCGSGSIGSCSKSGCRSGSSRSCSKSGCGSESSSSSGSGSSGSCSKSGCASGSSGSCSKSGCESGSQSGGSRSKHEGRWSNIQVPRQAAYYSRDEQDDAALSINDWGLPCTFNSDCQSGICSTSCSSLDVNPLSSQTCMCPCTDTETNKSIGYGSFRLGPCCCGCITNFDTFEVDGYNVVDSCPQPKIPASDDASINGWARGNLCEEDNFNHRERFGSPFDVCWWGDPEPALEDIPCELTYARLVIAGIADDDLMIPAGVCYKMNYSVPSENGWKKSGDPCDSAEECVSGMCGTGCDCPSEVIGTCSCNALCNWPNKCCTGCNIDTNNTLETCPPIDYDALANENGVPYNLTESDGFGHYWYAHRMTYSIFDGPTPWMPDSAHNFVRDPSGADDFALFITCIVYKYTMYIVPPFCYDLLLNPPAFPLVCSDSQVDQRRLQDAQDTTNATTQCDLQPVVTPALIADALCLTVEEVFGEKKGEQQMNRQ